uniref:Uncharacterized protein n=1 Tax=Oryza barthii TaxID=65489 RepID=A0A0D3GZC7_9ORYZ
MAAPSTSASFPAPVSPPAMMVQKDPYVHSSSLEFFMDTALVRMQSLRWELSSRVHRSHEKYYVSMKNFMLIAQGLI